MHKLKANWSSPSKESECNHPSVCNLRVLGHSFSFELYPHFLLSHPSQWGTLFLCPDLYSFLVLKNGFPFCHYPYTDLRACGSGGAGFFLPPQGYRQNPCLTNESISLPSPKWLAQLWGCYPSWVNQNNIQIKNIVMVRNLDSGAWLIWFDSCQKHNFGHVL